MSPNLAFRVADIFREHLSFQTPEELLEPNSRGDLKLMATEEQVAGRLVLIPVDSTCFDWFNAFATA